MKANEQTVTQQPKPALKSELNLQTKSVHRLPCRGCTVSCKYYTRCDGKPWRMEL